jgi:hypothetical protein
MPTDIYLGPVGQAVKLPGNTRPVELPLSWPTAFQELLSGASVVDRVGRGRRRYSLKWEALLPDEWAILERLALLPGPLVLDMPDRRNRLTANQSTGGDTGRTTAGVIARFQGTVAVSGAQFRSAPNSFAWSTGTALAATGRGLYLYNSATAVDDTWHPVRPSTSYVVSGYLRTSAAVSMQAGLDWHDASGTYLSSSLGTGTALPTGDWNTRVWVSASAPATAAWGIPLWINTTTTGAAITVYLDDPMVHEGSAAVVGDIPVQVVGTGVPRVAVVEFPASSALLGYQDLDLVLQEL